MATGNRYEIPRHIDLLNRELLNLVNRDFDGLIVSMPPRHGKSMLISHFFPAWYLGNNPDHRVLFISHNASFARQWGRKARDVLSEWGPVLWGINVRRDSRAADSWNIEEHDGGMDTTGVGGSHTGKGAHLFIVDDMVKSHTEALSQRFRDSAWELWLSSVETRAEPGCVFCVVGTRWHEDDIIGRLERNRLQDARQNWRRKIFNAICVDEDTDPLKRKAGDALWPNRYPVEKLEQIRDNWDSDEARLGPYWWNALYQQEPTPREGGIFKRQWFKYFSHDDEFYHLEDETNRSIEKNRGYRIITVDLAVSQKETADYFALGIWVVTPQRDLLLWDCIHERIAGPDQAPLIENLFKRHRPHFVGIESVAYQLSLVQDLQRRGIPAKPIPADRDKVARAQLAAARMSAGKLYFRKGAPWLQKIEDELLTFPNGKHDDLVDMTSMAALELSQYVVPSIA